MKSVTVASDLRPTVLNELCRLSDDRRDNGSRGAVERNYLLAIGLIDRRDGEWVVTPKGKEVLMQAIREDLI